VAAVKEPGKFVWWIAPTLVLVSLWILGCWIPDHQKVAQADQEKNAGDRRTTFLSSGPGPYNILDQHPTSNVPYPNAFLSKKLPNAGAGGPTHLMPKSDLIVAEMMSSGDSYSQGSAFNLLEAPGFGPGGQTYYATPGQNDGNHNTLYYGHATDPTYTLSGCSYGGTGLNGMTFHAPSGALSTMGFNCTRGDPASCFDKELAVWDQTTNKIFSFYNLYPGLPPCSGNCTLNVPNGYCAEADWATDKGYGNQINTASISPFGGTTRIAELCGDLPCSGSKFGHIHHHLRLLHLCSDTGGGTYPARQVFPDVIYGNTAYLCSDLKAKLDTIFNYANMPPNGALVFLDYTQAQLDCMDPTKAACPGISKLSAWQFPLIEAMVLYGGTLEDTGPYGGVYTSAIESEQALVWSETHGHPGAEAIATSFTHWLTANCTGSNCQHTTSSLPLSGDRWNLEPFVGISNTSDGRDVLHHMHLADPCVAIAMAGLPSYNGVKACP